jgi:hypothetical protein
MTLVTIDRDGVMLTFERDEWQPAPELPLGARRIGQYECVGLGDASMKRGQLAALLRSVDRFAAGDVAIGSLLHVMTGLSSLFVGEPWQREFGAAFSALEDRYALAAGRGKPLPTAADDEVAGVLGRLGQLVRSYMLELEHESEKQRPHVANDAAVDEERKFLVSNVAYEPETTLLRVEVVIGLDGSGGVAASFLHDRGGVSREANAALLRQAAEMVLEHAETMLWRPPGRPPE